MGEDADAISELLSTFAQHVVTVEEAPTFALSSSDEDDDSGGGCGGSCGGGIIGGISGWIFGVFSGSTT